MPSRLSKVRTSLLQSIDSMTFRVHGTGDYYCLRNKQESTKLYSKLGLWNYLFVKRLFELDSDYARRTVDSRVQKSGMVFGHIGGVFLFGEDSSVFDAYNLVVDRLIECEGKPAVSDDGISFKAIIPFTNDYGIYVQFNADTDTMDIWGYSREDSKLYVVSEYSSEVDGDTVQVIDSLTEPRKYKYLFDRNGNESVANPFEKEINVCVSRCTFNEVSSWLSEQSLDDLLSMSNQILDFYTEWISFCPNQGDGD